MTVQEPVYLIDGSAYIYRAYHAIAPLVNRDGLPTHAAYGFTNIMLRVIREKSPRFLAIAFDVRGRGFRHEIYPQYKANRPAMPDDLACQLPYIREIVNAYNILTLEQAGFEADDLIASAAAALTAKGVPVVIVSGDKDLLQLVSALVTCWDPMSDRVLGREGVLAKYGVPVERLADYFALTGDASDNVPGVAGIGPKGAEKLIGRYGSLDSLYAALDSVDKPALREKLAVNREIAFLSRRLVTLRHDVGVPGAAEDYRRRDPDADRLRELFAQLEFNRLLKSELPAARLDREGFRLVTTAEELDEVVREFAAVPFFAVDTETTSLDQLTADLVGISLCAAADRAFYIPVGHRDESGGLRPGQLPAGAVIAALRPLLEDRRIAKLCHNLKFDASILHHHGISMNGELWDTMIASYLLDPERRSHGLDDLGEEFLARRLTTFKEVTGGDPRPDSFAYVGLAEASDYSAEDALATFLLWKIFRPELERLGLWELFAGVEMAIAPILAALERTGILVDADILGALSVEFGRELLALEEKIYRLAGHEFNIGSPRQLGEVLFEQLRLPQGRKTKTGYSTDVKVLEKLAQLHELPAAVMTHRNLAKLKSTYVDKLITLVRPDTGRVHTSFNQTVTATGRLSSSNPNLQNIPIRSAEGQRIRAAFVAPPGHVLLAADYSQIDLRVLAHYSKDAALIEAFRQGEDVHRRTAAEIFRIHPELITPGMRRVAKSINFGIVYGMSAFGLASQLNLSRKEAATFIDRYFAIYPGVKRFMTEIVEQARRDGYVTTLLNRRRLLPEIRSSNKARREFAERTAINMPIQGTAADIIKLAMIRSVRMLEEAGIGAPLLLQIHDELVFEVQEKDVETTAVVVRKAMEAVLPLAVPLTVNIATGVNLSEV